MNERIQELMEQAMELVEGEFGPRQLNEEKFAELIVAECASRVDWILAEGGKTQGDLIKEHFGVEE